MKSKGQNVSSHCTSPTPLDPIETAVDRSNLHDPFRATSPPLPNHEPFLHSGWRSLRNKTAAAFEAAAVPKSRIIRFRACGQRCWILRRPSNPDELILTSERCHDRFCVPCCKARSSRLSATLLKLCEGQDLRFLTFTLRHNHRPLKEQLDRLTKCWRKLRQTRMWTTTQRGGVAIIELKRSKKNNTWHPHLHVISEGEFLPHSEVSNTWHRITGDSFIVDVRRLRDPREAVHYVAKYAAKGITFDGDYDIHVLAEAITALKSKRLVQCYGTWSHCKTVDEPTDDAWKRWITLEELILQARAGVLPSIELLQQLATRYANDSRFNFHRNRTPDSS
jgi:hypothetical protein